MRPFDEIRVTPALLSKVWRRFEMTVAKGPGAVGEPPVDDILPVPSEHVLLLAVSLPLPTRQKRLEALPFAIEDRIVGRPEAVHLALGQRIDANLYLVAVVDHDRMREWVAMADAAGLGRAKLLPDALGLPVPPAGHWSVECLGGRARVRRDNGTGFAIATDALIMAWEAGGRPLCIVLGEILPPGMTAVDILEVPSDKGPAVDLRQGIYARASSGVSPVGRRIAIVAAAGLLAHGAIAAADTVVMRHLAAKRGAETRALLTAVAPGAYQGEDAAEAATIAADVLPAGQATAPGRFLPLLERTSAALAPFGVSVAIDRIAFVDDEAVLDLDVTADDPAAIRQALTGAGLRVETRGADLRIRAAKEGHAS